jgi:hypothetical protein
VSFYVEKRLLASSYVSGRLAVRPSVPSSVTARLPWTSSREILYVERVVWKSVEKIQIWSESVKKNALYKKTHVSLFSVESNA